MRAPFYWIIGPEPLQRQDHLQRIRQTTTEQFAHCLRQRFELQTSDWPSFVQEVTAFNDLFASHRFIECHLLNKTPKEGLAFLQRLATQPLENCVLVFIAEKKEWIKGPAWQSLMKMGSVFWARPCASSGDFTEWIKTRAKRHQLKLEHGAILCLARYTEGNLLAADQFLEKLRILKQGLITEREIIHVLSNQMHASIFELTEMAFSGQSEKTFKILANLNSRGVEPVLVLWAITREVRIITHIAVAVQSGLPLAAACEQQGVWGGRSGLVAQALDLVPLRKFYTLLLDAQRIDSTIKGLTPGDAYQALGRLLFKLDVWLNKDRTFVA